MFGDNIINQPLYNCIVGNAKTLKNKIEKNRFQKAMMICYSISEQIKVVHSATENTYFPASKGLIDTLGLISLMENLTYQCCLLMDSPNSIDTMSQEKAYIINVAQQLQQMGHLLNFLYLTYKPFSDRKIETLTSLAKNIMPELMPTSICTTLDCYDNEVFTNQPSSASMTNQSYIKAIKVLGFLKTKENILKLCAIIFNSEVTNQEQEYFHLLRSCAGENMFHQGFVEGEDARQTFNLLTFNAKMYQELNSAPPTEIPEFLLSS